MRRYRIGRAGTNDIVLNEPTVSREHGELIELSLGTFSIRDFGSTYGTSVRQGSDWSLITTAEVRHRSQVRIGEFETTVADLLRGIDPTKNHADARAAPAWATPASRLSTRGRARHPETTHVGSDPLAAWGATITDGPPAQPQPSAIASRWRPMPEDKRIIPSLLAGLGAFLTVGLITLALALLLYAFVT